MPASLPGKQAFSYASGVIHIVITEEMHNGISNQLSMVKKAEEILSPKDLFTIRNVLHTIFVLDLFVLGCGANCIGKHVCRNCYAYLGFVFCFR